MLKALLKQDKAVLTRNKMAQEICKTKKLKQEK